MRTHFKANHVLERHLDLAACLSGSSEYVALMRPATRTAVLDTAKQIAGPWKAMLKRPKRPEAEAKAALARVRTARLLTRLFAGLQYWFGDGPRPAPLHGLGRLNLGTSPRENINRLHTVLNALEDMPGFPWPPGLTLAQARAVMTEASDALTELASLRRTLREAKKELQLLRAQVVALWKRHHLEAWIVATIPEAERPGWGMPPKTRRKRKTQKGPATPDPGLAEIVDFDEAAAMGRKSVPPDR